MSERYGFAKQHIATEYARASAYTKEPRTNDFHEAFYGRENASQHGTKSSGKSPTKISEEKKAYESGFFIFLFRFILRRSGADAPSHPDQSSPANTSRDCAPCTPLLSPCRARDTHTALLVVKRKGASRYSSTRVILSGRDGTLVTILCGLLDKKIKTFGHNYRYLSLKMIQLDYSITRNII